MFSNFQNRLSVDMESLLTQEQQQQDESSSSSSYWEFFSSSSPPEPAEGCCPTLSLTLQQRIGGCLGCMTLGYILSFGSMFRFRDLMNGSSTTFVLYFTLGNILSLSGSCFLYGPTSQMQKMWAESRRVATIVYLVSLILTLVLAIVASHEEWKKTVFRTDGICVGVLVVLMILQYGAVGWYCLSYIPFARQLARRCWRRLCATIVDFD